MEVVNPESSLATADQQEQEPAAPDQPEQLSGSETSQSQPTA